jgi:hypothetical protein
MGAVLVDDPFLSDHSEVSMSIGPRGSNGGGIPPRQGVGDCCSLSLRLVPTLIADADRCT